MTVRRRRRSTNRSTAGPAKRHKRLSMTYKGRVVYKGPNGGKYYKSNGTKTYLPNTTRRVRPLW